MQTDDQCEILLVASTTLTLDGGQALRDEVLRLMGSFLVHNDLQDALAKLHDIASSIQSTHQVHRLGDQPAGHADVDCSLLSVPSENPHLVPR